MYIYFAILILSLSLSFFNKEGFNPYYQNLRLNYYPDQKNIPNVIYAERCIQDILDSDVTKIQKEYLEDLLNLLQFI